MILLYKIKSQASTLLVGILAAMKLMATTMDRHCQLVRDVIEFGIVTESVRREDGLMVTSMSAKDSKFIETQQEASREYCFG